MLQSLPAQLDIDINGRNHMVIKTGKTIFCFKMDKKLFFEKFYDEERL